MVLATGSGKSQLPDWVEKITSDYPSDKLCTQAELFVYFSLTPADCLSQLSLLILHNYLCHSQQVNLNQLKLTGEKILIVGGGLTSGHLAKGAINLASDC